MNNKKIASQVIRALHKPTASGGGGGGGEVWRELEFAELDSEYGADYTLISYQIDGAVRATRHDFLRATIVLHAAGSYGTFRTNAFKNHGSFCSVPFEGEPFFGLAALSPDDEKILHLYVGKNTENDTFKLEKIEILEQ